MAKNRAIEITKVAAAKSRASHRATDFGVSMVAIAPNTGSKMSQVRAFANIITITSFYERDQHKHEHSQYCDSAEETDHVALYPSGLNMAQVTTECPHQVRNAVDDAID